MVRPKVLLIGGPNGAGKSTLAPRLLTLKGIETFVNADVIANGINPSNPGAVAIEAGRQMIRKLRELAAARESFAFESTLSSRNFAGFLTGLANDGYETTVHYVWIPSADVAVGRVAHRAASGGHFVPEQDVRRRFGRSVANFLHLYRPAASVWVVHQNEEGRAHRVLAVGRGTVVDWVADQTAWRSMMAIGAANDDDG